MKKAGEMDSIESVQGDSADNKFALKRSASLIGLHETDESEVRPVFSKLRELRDACRDRFALGDFTELSMGMSGDYVHAI